MKSKGLFQNVKIAVIAGYIILFLLTIFGGYNLYKQLLNFSNQDQPFIQRRQLSLISNALVSMYETESLRKILLTNDANIAQSDSAYVKSSNKIKFYLDSLYTISDDKTIQTSIDTVNVLLDKKEENLKNMLLLMEAINNLPYSKQIVTTVLSKKDINNLQDIFESNYSKQKSDSTYFIKHKKGFFSRVKDVFGDGQEKTTVKSSKSTENKDTTYRKPAELLTDTIVQFINDITLKSDRKKAVFMLDLSQKQNDMIAYDEELTAQIHQILYGLETKERIIVADLTAKKNEVLSHSSFIMSLIGWISLAIVILFSSLILWLINKIQSYRNKLEESKKRAEELMASRERLLLMISHDIKSPLNSILGHLELISKENMPEEQKTGIQNMRTSSEQILELVNKLMDYHKLEQGKSEVTNIAFAPYQLLEDIYESFVPVVKKGISYNKINIINTNQVYESDPFVIKQIINNLVGNAIKFTDKGEIKISSSVTEKNILKIAVSDTGKGISDEDQKKIFDEFQRVGNAEDKKHIDGFGLGLAITYKLVKLLGGKIEVDSTLGKGSTFTVSIPVKLTDITVLELKQTKAHSNNEVDDGQINAKILCVDDDVIMLNVFEKLFQRKGAEVVLVNDSKKALEIIQKERFDIILTDIQMPIMNGFELVEKIRILDGEYYKKVPVIALSARSDVAEETFRKAGFSEFLSKPVAFDSLINTVCKYIDCKKAIKSNIKKTTNKAETKGIRALVEFVEDDKETTKEILDIFASENEIKHNELLKSLKHNDWAQIKAISHKLLPLMKMIGENEVVPLLERLEKGEQQEEDVKIVMTRIKKVNKEVEVYLKEKLL